MLPLRFSVVESLSGTGLRKTPEGYERQPAVIFGASTLMVFGLAFSAPLLFIVFTARGRRWLEHLTRLVGRMLRWTGAIMVVLGLWTFWLALA